MIPDGRLNKNCEFVLGTESNFEENLNSELNDKLIKHGLSSSFHIILIFFGIHKLHICFLKLSIYQSLLILILF